MNLCCVVEVFGLDLCVPMQVIRVFGEMSHYNHAVVQCLKKKCSGSGINEQEIIARYCRFPPQLFGFYFPHFMQGINGSSPENMYTETLIFIMMFNYF